MFLVVASQAITAVTFALFDGHDVVREKTDFVAPEKHVWALDQVLREWSFSKDACQGVIVVTGPGSFTASRVSTTIANTLAFTWSVPVFGVENPHDLPLNELLPGVSLSAPGDFALPTYQRPAHITAPRPQREWG